MYVWWVGFGDGKFRCWCCFSREVGRGGRGEVGWSCYFVGEIDIELVIFSGGEVGRGGVGRVVVFGVCVIRGGDVVW